MSNSLDGKSAYQTEQRIRDLTFVSTVLCEGLTDAAELTDRAFGSGGSFKFGPECGVVDFLLRDSDGEPVRISVWPGTLAEILRKEAKKRKNELQVQAQYLDHSVHVGGNGKREFDDV
jgi:hypothetical protein